MQQFESKYPGKLRRDKARFRSLMVETRKSKMRPRTQRSSRRWNFHHDDGMSTIGKAEKTDDVTTSVASEGASGIGCNRREADFAEAAC